jgi:hypothetical protein
MGSSSRRALPELFSYRGPALTTPGFDVFGHLRGSKSCKDDREYLEELWSKFAASGLADDDFLEKFPAECPARIWEMRLACLMLDWGPKLVPSPKRGTGLDFGIELEGKRTVWVEATAPTPGDESSPDRVSAPLGQVIHGRNLDRTTAL